MKSYKYLQISILMLLSATLLIACFRPPLASKFEQDYDRVRQTYRARQNFFHYRSEERLVYFMSLQQSILNEMDNTGAKTLRIYEQMNMSLSGYAPNNEMFMLTENEIIKIPLKEVKPELYRGMTEERSDILTSDSTKVSVVTGYSEFQRRLYRYEYQLEPALLDVIVNAQELSFRYYAGPDRITVRYTPAQLKKLKALITAF